MPVDIVPASIQTRVQAAFLQGVLQLPRPLLRRIFGAPIRVDGQELALEAQALLRLQGLVGRDRMSADTSDKARRALRRGLEVVQPAPRADVEVTAQRIPTDSGGIDARLYRPLSLTEPSALMVFYHGGGFVVGDLDTHDDICRFVAKHADMRVLSVDYRLAPESPFPAGLDDSVDAYQYALEHAEEFGSSPDSIVVGGDSAGGNLATSVAAHAVRAGLKKPVLQFLLYPAVDATVRRRSRELFGNGYMLTDGDMTWFMDQYQPDEAQRRDTRLSVLLSDDLSGLPSTYIVTAGFDPLRDEGEEYARRLKEAGVRVVFRRFPDLLHGFANLHGAGGRFEQALFEVVGSLRAALALRD